MLQHLTIFSLTPKRVEDQWTSNSRDAQHSQTLWTLTIEWEVDTVVDQWEVEVEVDTVVAVVVDSVVAVEVDVEVDVVDNQMDTVETVVVTVVEDHKETRMPQYSLEIYLTKLMRETSLQCSPKRVSQLLV